MHQLHYHRIGSCPDLHFADKPPSFTNVLHKMHLTDPSLRLDPTKLRSRSPSPPLPANFGHDCTALLSDELLLSILSSLPEWYRAQLGLVCKRWLRLVDRLRSSITLLDWYFLAGPSRRLMVRFHDLAEIDLVPAAFVSRHSFFPVILTRSSYSLRMDALSAHGPFELPFLDSDAIDRGLEVLARDYPGLRKLCTIAAVESEVGLVAVALECPNLQELDLHCCSDTSLRAISAFGNLQILRLVASLNGIYDGPGVSDIGLTILAHGCKRLVKLELGGCEASFDGISAIGSCCLMLEELTIWDDRRMEGGWFAALPYCANLKTLRLLSCRKIDGLLEPLEDLGSCPAIERFQLHHCHFRDKTSLKALFIMCESIKEIDFLYCWGLDNDMFSMAIICRKVKLLSLEGCSKITTKCLESVILSWNDLQSLFVISCNSIRNDELNPALSSLFSSLKQLKWRPDSKSWLSMNLAGTGMGKKGRKFFRRFRG
ncbi:hypothetical protein HPP92_003077 [Vanilla planifolia]|uniref:F-box domain-containing protein n=1 Tax=Vanilla planifolia TaxID=51239 RepID=A0A835VMY2_VANPL|nr:hypothetical protein HPP92_003077 [Vanilla planifolia]